MKKAVILLLAALFILSLAACGGGAPPDDSSDTPVVTPEEASAQPEPEPEPEPEAPQTTPINFDGGNTSADVAEFTVSNMFTANVVNPPIVAGVHRFYEARANNTFIVLVVDVMNLQSSNVSADQILTVLLSASGGEMMTPTIAVVEDDGTSLAIASQRSIAPLAMSTLYYMFELSESAATGEMELVIHAGAESFFGTTDLQRYERNRNTIAIGDTITVEDVVSVTLEDVYFSNILNPPRPGRRHRFWEADFGNTFLIVKISAENLRGNDLFYDRIAGVSSVYDGRFNFSSFMVIETDGGSDLNGFPGQRTIPPLGTGVGYFLMEVPERVAEGSVEIAIFIGGEFYYFSINA